MAGREKTAIYYERVSTTHDSQEESLENQRKLVESYLKRHPEIKLAEPLDTYSERVSGKSDERPRFQSMLKRVEQGDIDFVLIKDFKRLSRSVEVSTQLKDYAKEYGFQFILLSTGQKYDPNDPGNRMLYGFESLINEDLVYRQSEYARLAHRQKCEAKKLNRNNVTFGFRWDAEKKDIVIDDEKAEIMRTLYELYVFRNQSLEELRRYLAGIGLHYTTNTIAKWLSETAYIGIFHINKKGSELGVGSGKKTKRFINPVEEWVAVERPDLAFLDKELFEMAQIMRNRSKNLHQQDKNGVNQSRFKGYHLFSAKIFCAECGSSYVHGYSDRKETIGIYRHRNFTKKEEALKSCKNDVFGKVYEEDLINLCAQAINGVIADNRNCMKVLLKELEDVIRNEFDQRKELARKRKELNALNVESEKVMQAYIDAPVHMRSKLAEKSEGIEERINKVQSEIDRLERANEATDDIRVQMEEIEKEIKRWEVITTEQFDKDVVNSFISKILIHHDGRIEIVLNTNKAIEYMLPQKKRNSKKSSSFFMPMNVFFGEEENGSRSDVFALIKAFKEGKKQSVGLTLISFLYKGLKGKRRTQKDAIVLVKIVVWI